MQCASPLNHGRRTKAYLCPEDPEDGATKSVANESFRRQRIVQKANFQWNGTLGSQVYSFLQSVSRPVPEIQTGTVISWNKNHSHHTRPAYLYLMISEDVIEENSLFLYGLIYLSEQKLMALAVPIPHIYISHFQIMREFIQDVDIGSGS